MGLGPIVSEPLEFYTGTSTGPILSEPADFLSSGSLGPIDSEPLDQASTGSISPIDSEIIDIASSGGLGVPGSEIVWFTLPATGPTFDSTTALIPTTSLGTPSDAFINSSIVDSIGAIFDHDVDATPTSSIGPASDTFIGVPTTIKYGPVFDHDVDAILGGIPAHGPCFDGFAEKSIDALGPVFDHIIAAAPPMLPVLTPESVAPPTPERNRLEPEQVEFLSAGVYKLEKSPNGKLTGFKY